VGSLLKKECEKEDATFLPLFFYIKLNESNQMQIRSQENESPRSKEPNENLKKTGHANKTRQNKTKQKTDSHGRKKIVDAFFYGTSVCH